MIEKIIKYQVINLRYLLIVPFLLSCILVTAQDTEQSRQIIKNIQDLSEKDSLPDAKDIILKVIEQYGEKGYKSEPFYFHNLYRKTSVDAVLNKDSIESQLAHMRNSSDLISRFVIRPFDFSFQYARSNGKSDEANVTVLLFEDYKSIFADNLNKKRGQTIHASQNNGIFETIGHKNISYFLDEIFGDINLFKETNDIMLLAFKGPLHKSNTETYTYKLLGQKQIDGQTCNEIAFFCTNMKENAFAGNLYTSIGENPKLIKAQFTFNNRESANFLKDILLTHSFNLQDSIIIPVKQESILLIGDDANRMMAAKRTDIFFNYNFDKPNHNIRWGVSREKGYFRRDTSFWATIRPIPLTNSQKQIGNLEQAADSSKRFRRLERVISLVLSGSYSLGGIEGPVELGPLTHFLSYNDMEGLRIRVGGNTTIRFSDQFQLGGYIAYGTKDTRVKHQANLVYSLSPKQKYLWEYPKKLFSFTYASDLNIPGQDMLLMNRDHFAQSFTHAPTNNMSLQRIGLLTFESENSSNLTYKIGGKITYDKPLGVVQYVRAISPTDTTVIDNITSSDLILSLRFAPGERFIQRKEKRTAIRRAAFELDVTYRRGIKGLFGADYGYNAVNFNLFRRFDFTRNIAQVDTYLSGGKIWGRVPFPLLFIPEGNQSYVFNSRAYNVMNFYEFATDRFIAGSVNSTFDWSPIRLFNPNNKIKICVGSKIIYGPLSEENDPAYHPDLFMFNNGIRALGNTPYAEFNIGLANIFNMIRIDYSRRLTYLDSDDTTEGNKITRGTILFSGSFSF